jgi:hypothetical protein
MLRSKPVFALAYDFDGTLAPGNQEHSFISALGIRNAKDFWTRSNEHAVASQGDPILLYMRSMLEGANHENVKVDRSSLKKHGATIPLFDGVEDWFHRANAAGKQRPRSAALYHLLWLARHNRRKPHTTPLQGGVCLGLSLRSARCCHRTSARCELYKQDPVLVSCQQRSA